MDSSFQADSLPSGDTGTSSPYFDGALLESQRGLLDRLSEHITSSRTALITGREGSGKTTIARALFTAAASGSLPGITAVCWIDYFESLELSMLGAFRHIPAGDDAGRRFEETARYLAAAGSSLLVIIDNAGDEPAVFPSLVSFFASHMTRTVFVSGFADRNLECFPVGALSRSESVRLFLSRAPSAAADDAADAAARLRDCPLALSIAAGAFEATGKLPPAGDPADIQDAVGAVAAAADIAATPEEKLVLRKCSLLPAGLAWPARTLGQLFGQTGVFSDLARKGLIERRLTGAAESFVMNPALSTALRNSALASHEENASFYAEAASGLSMGTDDGPARTAPLFFALSVSRWMISRSTQKPYLFTRIAQMLEKLGCFAKANVYYEKAMESARKNLGESHNLLASVGAGMARCLSGEGDYAHAAHAFAGALAMLEGTGGGRGVQYASLAARASDVALFLCDHEKALELASKSWEIYREVMEGSAEEVRQRWRTARIYNQTGRSREASVICLEAIAGCAALLGEDPVTDSLLHSCAAESLQNAGNFETAFYYAWHAQETASGDTAASGQAALALARHHMHFGQPLRAAECIKQALAAAGESYPDEHPETSSLCLAMAGALEAAGAVEKAGNYYRKHLRIQEKSIGRYASVKAYANIAGVYRTMGAKSSCLSFYDMAAQKAARANGPNHPQTAGALNDYALALMYFGEHDKAIAAFEKAKSSFEYLFGKEDSVLGVIYSNIGACWLAKNNYALAIRNLVSALNVHRKTLGPTDKTTLETTLALYTAYMESNDHNNARHYLEEYLENGGTPLE